MADTTVDTLKALRARLKLNNPKGSSVPRKITATGAHCKAHPRDGQAWRNLERLQKKMEL